MSGIDAPTVETTESHTRTVDGRLFPPPSRSGTRTGVIYASGRQVLPSQSPRSSEFVGPQCAAEVAACAVATFAPAERLCSWDTGVPTSVVPKYTALPAAPKRFRCSESDSGCSSSVDSSIRAEKNPRWLCRLVWLAVAALLVSSAALGMVQVGLIGHSSGSRQGPSRSLPRLQGQVSLLKEVSTTSGQASYSVNASSYSVTVSTNRPSWVELTPSQGSPIFAEVIEPGMIHRFTESGTITMQVGAGGTSIEVSTAYETHSLMAPVAPFTFLLSPAR
jgi:hypothetical protein